MHRPFFFLLLCGLSVFGFSSEAASGRIIKVLPHFLDAKGRHTLSPSLYERDAYQFFLRNNPDKRSALRFDVEWKSKGADKLKLRMELRGAATGNLANQFTLEKPVTRHGLFGQWSGLTLEGKDYHDFGEVTAWRATLWDGDQLLAEQKSFLW